MEDVPNLPDQKSETGVESNNPPLETKPPEAQPIPTPAPTTPSPSVGVHNLNQVMSENTKDSSVISYDKKKSFLDYFIYIVAVIAFLVWIAVLALFLQNREADGNDDAQTPVSEVTQTPTVEQKQYNISIKNGNVVNLKQDGTEETLIKKEDYKDTGIAGFVKATVSPDKKRICVESWPPSTDPALYVSNIDGTSVVKVNSNRKNCVWSDDGTFVAYNDVKGEKEGTDLYIYSILDATEELLTVHTATESAKPKLHTAKSWSSDGKKINCEYSYVKTSSQILECEAEIDSHFVKYF